MTERYFKKTYGDEYYIFDSETITEKEFEEKFDYEDYRAFEDSMMGDDVVNCLNEQHKENEKLKLHLHILEQVVYMLDNEVEKASEEGFEVSDWYINYLTKGKEDLD